MCSSRHWGSVAAVLGSAIGLSGNLEEIPELLCALVVLICKMGINCFIKKHFSLVVIYCTGVDKHMQYRGGLYEVEVN